MLPMIIINIILIISIIWLAQLNDINTITQPKFNNTQFNITQSNNEQFFIRPIINDMYPYPIDVLDLMVYRI
jgi:hypothetical protein